MGLIHTLVVIRPTDRKLSEKSKMQKRKRHYNTWCHSWPQKGEAVTLSLETMAPIIITGKGEKNEKKTNVETEKQKKLQEKYGSS